LSVGAEVFDAVSGCPPPRRTYVSGVSHSQRAKRMVALTAPHVRHTPRDATLVQEGASASTRWRTVYSDGLFRPNDTVLRLLKKSRPECFPGPWSWPVCRYIAKVRKWTETFRILLLTCRSSSCLLSRREAGARRSPCAH